jgi:hypothetical protein
LAGALPLLSCTSSPPDYSYISRDSSKGTSPAIFPVPPHSWLDKLKQSIGFTAASAAVYAGKLPLRKRIKQQPHKIPALIPATPLSTSVVALLQLSSSNTPRDPVAHPHEPSELTSGASSLLFQALEPALETSVSAAKPPAIETWGRGESGTGAGASNTNDNLLSKLSGDGGGESSVPSVVGDGSLSVNPAIDAPSHLDAPSRDSGSSGRSSDAVNGATALAAGEARVSSSTVSAGIAASDFTTGSPGSDGSAGTAGNPSTSPGASPPTSATDGSAPLLAIPEEPDPLAFVQGILDQIVSGTREQRGVHYFGHA